MIKLLALLTLSISLYGSIEEIYTPAYCLELETAYGHGMLSEGGEEAIRHMFDTVLLTDKRALEIGSGLGQVAFFLAKNFDMTIVGLEVTPWMVLESKKRTPKNLKSKVDFLLTSTDNKWPMLNRGYDIIYSKGVLTHVENKEVLLRECHRLLSPEGVLVITDWFCQDQGWGDNIAKLIELENLPLFAQNEESYIDALTRCGFTVIDVRDDSALYLKYNKQIATSLDSVKFKEAVEGYEAIIKAIETGELRVMRFIARGKI